MGIGRIGRFLDGKFWPMMRIFYNFSIHNSQLYPPLKAAKEQA
jgi:hypothetical protein